MKWLTSLSDEGEQSRRARRARATSDLFPLHTRPQVSTTSEHGVPDAVTGYRAQNAGLPQPNFTTGEISRVRISQFPKSKNCPILRNFS